MVEYEYTVNFLSRVTFRMDFPSITDTSKFNDFRKLIKDKFPIVQESKSTILELDLREEEEVDSRRKEGSIRWTFYNKNKTIMAAIDKTSLSLEFIRYDNFSEFFSFVDFLLGKLFEVFPDVFSTRIGLRYQNNIELEEGDPLEWSNYLNNNLIKYFDFFTTDEKKDMAKSVGRTEIFKDDHNLVFQFGIPNSLYPSEIIRKEFTLDYDCSTEESLEKVNILLKVKEFHEVIKSFFEKSIKNDLRLKMGAII